MIPFGAFHVHWSLGSAVQPRSRSPASPATAAAAGTASSTWWSGRRSRPRRRAPRPQCPRRRPRCRPGSGCAGSLPRASSVAAPRTTSRDPKAAPCRAAGGWPSGSRRNSWRPGRARRRRPRRSRPGGGQAEGRIHALTLARTCCRWAVSPRTPTPSGPSRRRRASRTSGSESTTSCRASSTATIVTWRPTAVRPAPDLGHVEHDVVAVHVVAHLAGVRAAAGRQHQHRAAVRRGRGAAGRGRGGSRAASRRTRARTGPASTARSKSHSPSWSRCRLRV